VHITSDDFMLNQVTDLKEDGRFETKYAAYLAYPAQPMYECGGIFDVLIRGKVNCASEVSSGLRSMEVSTEWVETSHTEREGCQSLSPCRFKTQSRLECPRELPLDTQ
jgi:hypothetical protein